MNRAPLLQISYSLSEIKSDLHHFWQLANQYRIIAFNGDMGAGKTTFIHHLCDYLGVEDAVSSPTFALINEYHFLQEGKDKTIFHMDWYRINSEEEAINAGLEDALNNKDAYCFVEWPEKALSLLPKPYLWIDIEVEGEGRRKMTCIVLN
jgi:tRNA threonylcarbamoyladenosine biosynthesis protein TsaE